VKCRAWPAGPGRFLPGFVTAGKGTLRLTPTTMTPVTPIAFSCERLGKAFASRRGIVSALEDVSLSVREREFVCIVGPSGCGKTTLLKLIAGLLRPTSGRVTFEAEVQNGVLRTALVFQEHGLFPWMTVLDNVAFGLEMRALSRSESRERARDFIDKVGLAAFMRNYPHELSFGMRQRVGIARAFVADPQILLMDEPFGALDAQTKRLLQDELLRIWRHNQKTVVFVSHDIEETVRLGDRVLVMTGRPGRIREEIPVPLPRPRELSQKDRPEIAETTWRIWKMLEDEVRRELNMPS
jgi:NitT/TauT family transport system ATP-binding protein